MASIEKRTTPDGDTSYRVKIRIKGFPTQTATFQRLTDAKDWAKITEGAIKDRRYFRNSESKKRTLKDMLDRYIRDVLPNKPKSKDKQAMQLEWWSEQIGEYFLADISPAMIAEQRDKLRRAKTRFNKPYSPATVNRYLAALSHAFTVAVNDWGWLEDSPLRRVTKQKEPRGRVRFLDDEERKRLLAACRESKHHPLYTIVVLALSTGARRGEIANINWKDVDFIRKSVTLHETKNGERRILPLAGHALDCLKEHEKIRRIDTDFVFPSNDGKRPADIQFYWNQAVKKAALQDFRFHDLRHSAASYLAMNGASLAEIAEVLGHKTLQMVKRYAHLSEAHTSKVVASMNERIFG